MKFAVTAQSFNRKTGKETAKSRTEIIDTLTNDLFPKCKTILDVKEAYESFWNHLNPNSKEVVFVSRCSLTKRK